MYSIIIPVYKNEDSIAPLLRALERINLSLDDQLEVVFVIDGSPDRSFQTLNRQFSLSNFRCRVILLSRNFGSISAVRAGLSEATGPYFAVMAADLQEPPELLLEFFKALRNEEVDVTVGVRESRQDPLFSKILSRAYWSLYKKFVESDMPRGGVDIFGCNLVFRDQLLAVNEANSSLVGLIFWLGFKRKLIPYQRRKREHGKSAWTLTKKLRYMSDSIFSFTDLPIRLLGIAGFLGLASSFLLTITTIIVKQIGLISVPGYSATVIMILFFAGINCMGLSILGGYVWRAFENTKNRPQAIVMDRYQYARKTPGQDKRPEAETPNGLAFRNGASSQEHPPCDG